VPRVKAARGKTRPEDLRARATPLPPMTAANQAGLKDRTLMGFIVEYRGGVG
jgi:hypothetical protein